MQTGHWSLHLIWAEVQTKVKIITLRGLHIILMPTKVGLPHTDRMRTVAGSLLWDQMNGIKSEETTTKKVSSWIFRSGSLLTKSIVERRRRETINEGINELAKIVPGCEKNKGSILQRGVEFIIQLKDNEARNIEKWTLEKLLTDQAISELSSSVDRLKDELQRTQREVARWRTTCESAGLEPKDEDAGGTDDGET